MSGKELGFGIIGCGMIANFHATAIREIAGARMIGATDVVKESRSAFAEKYAIRAFDTAEELLASPEVDVVCICTPTGYHAALAIKAAKAGKHIVAEKPMALNLKEADEVIKAVESSKVKMEVISQLRFAKAVRRLKKAVDDGILGKLVTGDIYMKFYRSQEYYDKGGWRGTWKMDGGGAVMNQGIHGIDLLQYVMGPVKSIFAHTRTLVRNIEVEDTASALLEYKNGALGVIQGTTSVYPGLPRRMEISGEKGTIILEEDTFVSWKVQGEEVPADVTIGKTESGASSDPGAISNKGHILQLGDLVEAVRENREPMVGPLEGRKPIEIIMAIYDSAKKGKLVRL